LGIIGSILGRRDIAGPYRTVDGGHPAPYPEMTDEQLYNYEIAFNVPNPTFERRPVKAKAAAPEAAAEPAVEPAAKAATEKVLDSARFSARRARTPGPQPAAPQPMPQPQANDADRRPLDLSKPVRLVTTRQPVEIITTRARHPVFKVHGYIGDATVATVFTLDGQLSENGPCYLENIPEQRHLYLNIYPHPHPESGELYRITQHATRSEADALATPGRLVCAPVQFDDSAARSERAATETITLR